MLAMGAGMRMPWEKPPTDELKGRLE